MNRPGRLECSLQPIALPRAPVPPLNPAHFFLCAVPCADPVLGAWQLELYRWAIAQAQAVAQPSLVERDLLAVWN